MLNSDTIAAISSPSVAVGQTARSIVRLSGAGVWSVLAGVLTSPINPKANSIQSCCVRLTRRLEMDAMLYCFRGPHSYTGEDMAELHLWAAPDAAAALLARLCEKETTADNPFARLAEPGEFTLRAYLNGKMDLTQAEAVAQIVSSANTLQLAAAEKLLHGRFSQTIARVRSELLDVLSLLEAGLDFAEEDISFIPAEQAAARTRAQRDALQELLDGSVQLERMIDLDAVGLAGLPNAGKSSLLNALLGTARSIVSPIEATTRDILTAVLDLDGVSCVLFDCAGLLPDVERRDPVDRLAHQAAMEALQQAAVVLYCVDAGKTAFEADVQMLGKIQPATVIPVATKADLPSAGGVDAFFQQHSHLFSAPPAMTSAHTGQGLDALKKRIKTTLVTGRSGDEYADRLTLNRRHRRRLQEAVKALADAADEIAIGREDAAAMLLRQSYETLGGLEREDVSEKILDGIFSRFCIGK